MLIKFSECARHLGEIKGVIHIGAHEAEEAQDYSNCGVKKVFWMEANDELYDVIVDTSKRAGLNTEGAIGYAISNVDDEEVELQVTNNSQASSILKFGSLQNHYPLIEVSEKKVVKTRTVASIFEEQDVDINDYQFVNIDIQGAELLALQGFGDLLHSPSLKGLYLEVNYEQLYEGTALVDELDAYLAPFGFYRKLTSSTPYSWGDALYVRKPIENVSVECSNTTHRGPGGVASGLLRGLNDLRAFSKASENIGLLQAASYCQKLPQDTLAGPNLFVLPTDMPGLTEHFTNFLTPSKWTQDLYQSFPAMKNKKVSVWSAGIDTQKWKPDTSVEKTLDCFIYFKNRTQKELTTIQYFLSKFGYSHKTISYGSYKEEELMDLCNQARFCVMLNGTESQGLAVMNIMSMNVPLLVFDTPTWSNGQHSCPATSIPCFDYRCGSVAPNNLTSDTFTNLKEKMKNFKPREYILEGHTIHQSAGRYLELMAERLRK